jgi:demethylmenaquinone methyltransferase/2-methoxy-6-polyprenyl-1,4-benzoquinol methylase
MNDRTPAAGAAPVPPPSPSPAAARADARALAAMDVAAHLADPARKQAFVTPMFDVIAPRYDDFTRLFSFGMDARWKERAIAAAVSALHGLPAGDVAPSGLARTGRLAVDLACGTGDLAVGVARRARAQHPGLRVLGVDAAQAMVRHARHRLATVDADVAAVVHVAHGDMTAIALPDASADVVTAGYAVRNAPDARLAIREAARVLRTGGTYVTLDFYRPALAPWRALLLTYLRVAGDVVGWTWHRSPVVYGYIARSIEQFMSWQAFSAELAANGFRVRSVTRWLGGGVALHVAERT